jgi:6-phosphogluconolactonase (cycloisomerase 2 family)
MKPLMALKFAAHFKKLSLLGLGISMLACSGGDSNSVAVTERPVDIAQSVTSLPLFLLAVAPASSAANFALYGIDSNSGAMGPNVNTASNSLTNPFSVTFNPWNNVIFTAGYSEVDSLSLDINSGANTQLNKFSTNQLNLYSGLASNPRTNSLIVVSSPLNTIRSITYDNYGNLLSLGSAQVTGTKPTAVVVDSYGQFAYVANSQSNNVTVFPIARSGAILPSSQVISAKGVLPTDLRIDPLGRFLYVINAGAQSIEVFLISNIDGSLTDAGTIPTHSATFSLEIESSGQLAIVSNLENNNVSIYFINPTNGLLSEAPSSPFATGKNPNALAITPNSTYLYVSNKGDQTLSIFSFNLLSQNLTLLSNIKTNSGIQKLYIFKPRK